MALHAGIRYAKSLAGIIIECHDLRTNTRTREASPANSKTPFYFVMALVTLLFQSTKDSSLRKPDHLTEI